MYRRDFESGKSGAAGGVVSHPSQKTRRMGQSVWCLVPADQELGLTRLSVETEIPPLRLRSGLKNGFARDDNPAFFLLRRAATSPLILFINYFSSYFSSIVRGTVFISLISAITMARVPFRSKTIPVAWTYLPTKGISFSR